MEDVIIQRGGPSQGSKRCRISGVQKGRGSQGINQVVDLRGSGRWRISEDLSGGGSQGFREVDNLRGSER